MVSQDAKELRPLGQNRGEVVVIDMVYLAHICFSVNDVLTDLKNRRVVGNKPCSGQKSFMAPVTLCYVYKKRFIFLAELFFNTLHEIEMKGHRYKITA